MDDITKLKSDIIESITHVIIASNATLKNNKHHNNKKKMGGSVLFSLAFRTPSELLKIADELNINTQEFKVRHKNLK